MTRFGYFVVQARAEAGSDRPPVLAGVVENLATGEKWRFATPEELIDHLVGWARRDPPDGAPGPSMSILPPERR
ncbi:MAG: hypothetical protein ACKVZ0_09060 [Gemmatimonadales bacterium]